MVFYGEHVSLGNKKNKEKKKKGSNSTLLYDSRTNHIIEIN